MLQTSNSSRFGVYLPNLVIFVMMKKIQMFSTRISFLKEPKFAAFVLQGPKILFLHFKCFDLPICGVNFVKNGCKHSSCSLIEDSNVEKMINFFSSPQKIAILECFL